MLPTSKQMAQPKSIFLKDYQPSHYLIKTVDLYFRLGEQATQVRNTMEIERNPIYPEAVALELAGEELELLEIRLNDSELKENDYTLGNGDLSIAEVPASFRLQITTKTKPQENTSLMGLYKSSGNFCTQCEAEGFRKITYFLDRPDVMAVYTATIEADKGKYPVLLSNGNRIGGGDGEAGRHWVKWHDPFAKPSYLFALVAGDLAHIKDKFLTMGGRSVDLLIYTQHHNIDKCDHAMTSLKNAMSWDEKVYGREYDLDNYMVVVVDDFNMGAMENKGLNIFNSKYVLAEPETATDTDYQNIEGVIGHEYFHNWSGNRVTCRDWFQLSLKEGFTVFRDQEFSADSGSRGVKRIQDVIVLRSYQFPEDSGPMAHAVRPESFAEINNFYTLTVYNKGAEVIRMLHNILGPQAFRCGCDLYFSRHDGQAVTTDDFVKSMEDANNFDLGQFKLWYSQAGTPTIEVKGIYNRDSKSFTLTMNQNCPATPGQDKKLPFHIPIATAFFNPDGKEISLSLAQEQAVEVTPVERVLNLTEKRQQFIFEGVGFKPVPSMLRGFSAPVNLEYDYSNQELALLLAHDTDGFNRWEAGQRLGKKILLGLAEDFQAGKELALSDDLENAFRMILQHPGDDPAMDAELLTLPSEAYLAEFMVVIDPTAIHSVKRFVQKELAKVLAEMFVRTHQRLDKVELYKIDPSSIGRRRLKNVCLTYLIELDDDEQWGRAISQYQQSNNMTDSIAALGCIVNSSSPNRENILQHFHKRWKHEALVVDKWLAIQAACDREDTLDKVKALKLSKAYDIRNPNKVRALIGTFCHHNQIRFHASSGCGYQFISEVIKEIDPKNPQVAARLVTAFSQWRRYDQNRQQMMRIQLEAIAAHDPLSKDVAEIVHKSLQL